MRLLELTNEGLFCASGGFHIDPWGAVDFAVTTHAHSDHARRGSRHYLTAEAGQAVLRQRLGGNASIEGLCYGRPVTRNGVSLALHPAGHILGSAQVRVEYRGEVWVVSGDYKVEAEPTCAPFEPVRCHTFITESTFGLPIFRWPPAAEVFREIDAWWRGNQSAGRASVVFAYSLGKAQRVMAGIDASIGPVFVHASIAKLLPHYRAAGVSLPVVQDSGVPPDRQKAARGLVIAPSSARESPWLRSFGDISTAFASGWMQIRGARRRYALDRGFVLSDHADWPGLMECIRATGATRVLVTHGFMDPMVRWLQEHGSESAALPVRFAGETGEVNEVAPDLSG